MLVNAGTFILSGFVASCFSVSELLFSFPLNSMAVPRPSPSGRGRTLGSAYYNHYLVIIDKRPEPPTSSRGEGRSEGNRIEFGFLNLAPGKAYATWAGQTTKPRIG